MAELAARELQSLALDDALDLCVLMAELQPARFERAAVRWHGQLQVEAQLLTLADSQLALAALASLRAARDDELRQLNKRFTHAVNSSW